MKSRPQLRALGRRLGILDCYDSALDGETIYTVDSTREALCVAMGYEASTEAEAEASLERLAGETHARGASSDTEISAADPHAPLDEAQAARERGGAEERCLTIDEVLGESGGVFGIWANLYSLRSPRNLGFGDFGDLAELARWTGREGGAFVGLNPLHALGQYAPDPCPYQPASRLYREPLYLAIDAIPEMATCTAARRRLATEGQRARIEALRDAARIDVAAVRRELNPILRMLFEQFTEQQRREPDAPRCREFAAYRDAQGRALEDFAAFRALEHTLDSGDWREWPATFSDPGHSEVDSFRKNRASEVDFHAWLQFEIDRQLRDAASAASSAGLSIGLYTDLALGSAPSGSDAWAFQDCFARGVSLGAPPDDFSRAGQSWNIPPMIPEALRARDYEPWRLLLRSGFRHAGALRIDHALGLRRQFWIPAGRPAREGAYVVQPEAELMDVVAQESRRAGALVIAEDLGTVPPGFSEVLMARGMLTSRVLLFERGDQGFHAKDGYPRQCLATVNTHDLPPFAAWLCDDDLDLRRASGQIPDDDALAELGASRKADHAALEKRFVADGLLEARALDAGTLEGDDFAAAATRFLGDSPAALVGIGLDDLASESEPINLPGVPRERHPSWTRRMGRELEAIGETTRCEAILAAVTHERRRT